MKRILILFLFLTTFLFSNIGKVTAFSGKASIERNDKTINVKTGLKIFKNDTVTTNSNSKIQIHFNDNSVITLGKNAVFKIKDYNFDVKNPKKSKVNFKFFKGAFKTITGKIGKINKNSYKLSTKSASMGIRGSIGAGNQDSFLVLDGGYTLEKGGKTVILDKGMMTDFSGLKPSAPRVFTQKDLSSLGLGILVKKATNESSSSKKSSTKKNSNKKNSETDGKEETAPTKSVASIQIVSKIVEDKVTKVLKASIDKVIEDDTTIDDAVNNDITDDTSNNDTTDDSANNDTTDDTTNNDTANNDTTDDTSNNDTTDDTANSDTTDDYKNIAQSKSYAYFSSLYNYKNKGYLNLNSSGNDFSLNLSSIDGVGVHFTSTVDASQQYSYMENNSLHTFYPQVLFTIPTTTDSSLVNYTNGDNFEVKIDNNNYLNTLPDQIDSNDNPLYLNDESSWGYWTKIDSNESFTMGTWVAGNEITSNKLDTLLDLGSTKTYTTSGHMAGYIRNGNNISNIIVDSNNFINLNFDIGGGSQSLSGDFSFTSQAGTNFASGINSTSFTSSQFSIQNQFTNSNIQGEINGSLYGTQDIKSSGGNFNLTKGIYTANGVFKTTVNE